MSLATEEMIRLAESLWVVAGMEGREAQLAVANLARNLAKRGASAEAICERMRGLARWPFERTTPPALSERCREPGFRDWVETLCWVFAGKLRDPTCGATAAHLHTEEPAWAERAHACALIGPWLFYCDET